MDWQDRLKNEWENNPLQVILIGSFAATALSKLVDSVSAVRSRRAYARQVDYRTRR